MDNGAASYRRFIDGDQEAFGEIVDLYRENLIFFIHRYVNDLDTAEDLAEDAFVELIVHPERFEGKSSLLQKKSAKMAHGPDGIVVRQLCSLKAFQSGG